MLNFKFHDFLQLKIVRWLNVYENYIYINIIYYPRNQEKNNHGHRFEIVTLAKKNISNFDEI